LKIKYGIIILKKKIFYKTDLKKREVGISIEKLKFEMKI
jgi:hypothetical protein